MRASIAAESASIPSVSIICEGFAGQATATARGMGFDGLPLAVTVGHVDAQSVEEMTSNFIKTTVDDIIAGLTAEEAIEGIGSAEPAALDIAASGTIDEINELFVARGWTDGNPVIPPTQDRIERYLEGSGHDPWKTLGVAPIIGHETSLYGRLR